MNSEKVCINGRDELLVLNLKQIACFKADDDYTVAYYLSGVTTTIAMGLSKIEVAVSCVPKSKTCNYVRIGRSLIINQAYLYQIQVLNQKLILFDGEKKLSIMVSKDALKRYKQHVADRDIVNSPTNPMGSPQMN